ncbi:MAG: hypothetical protein ABSC92_09700 [Rhizomicrobium sp.]|jgi:hypothetical protein
MKSILPLIVPVLIVALILRRSMTSRTVRVQTMWIRPAILLILACVTLATTRLPGPIALAAFVAAGLVGAGVGYLRARHLELSVDPETGVVSSKATPIGTILIVGLVAVRIGLRFAFPEMGANPGGHVAADAVAWTDGALIFSAAMLVTQAIEIWLRTQPLLAEHAARRISPTGQP